MQDQKRTIVSFKDVILAHFGEGLQGVKALNPAPKTLEKAIEALEGMGQDTTALEAMLQEMGGSTSDGKRGRKTPSTGDTRLYKAGKNGVVISYSHLGVEQGGSVGAVFGNDEDGPYIVLRGSK
jgi:hypothetical protein